MSHLHGPDAPSVSEHAAHRPIARAVELDAVRAAAEPTVCEPSRGGAPDRGQSRA